MARIDRQKAKQRKQKRMLMEEKKRAMQAEMDSEDMPEEMDAEDMPKKMKKEEPEPEEVEKGMDMPMGENMSEPMMMPMGPTTFEELDAERAAREKAEAVQETVWDTQDLVRNILHSMLPPEEKASRISEVAAGFEERVTEMIDGEEIEKDMELLEVEALLAAIDRHAPALQKAWDFVKEEVSYASRKAKPDSSFALVYTDANGNKVRKYLIHDASHVRNALARAAQQIKRGGAGATDARKALPKIRAAAKKFGIETSMEKGLHIEKDAKGDWRWIGKPSNNFIDKQNDIMSQAAHRKYCAWLDKNADMAPLFVHWHVPGTQRTSPVDFWMEHEGALIMSGILTEPEAARLLHMQKQVDLGMSVQGIGLRLNRDDPREITDYWLYEVSDLPLESAANPFTSLETITKEAGMDKLQYLTEMMGSKEKAEDFLKRTGQMQKELQEAGITSKEQGEPVAEPKTASQPALEVEALIQRLKKEFALEDLNAFVAQAQEDHEKVATLEELVKALQQTDDEKLAGQLTPPAARYAWSRENRASQSDATKIKKDKGQEEDEKLSKAAPGVPEGYWLSEVTHTAPIVQEV